MKKKEMEAQLAELADLLACEPDKVVNVVRFSMAERDVEFERLSNALDAEIRRRLELDHKLSAAKSKAAVAEKKRARETSYFERLGRRTAKLEQGARFQVRGRHVDVDINLGDFRTLRDDLVEPLRRARSKAMGWLAGAALLGGIASVVGRMRSKAAQQV